MQLRKHRNNSSHPECLCCLPSGHPLGADHLPGGEQGSTVVLFSPIQYGCWLSLVVIEHRFVSRQACLPHLCNRWLCSALKFEVSTHHKLNIFPFCKLLSLGEHFSKHANISGLFWISQMPTSFCLH